MATEREEHYRGTDEFQKAQQSVAEFWSEVRKLTFVQFVSEDQVEHWKQKKDKVLAAKQELAALLGDDPCMDQFLSTWPGITRTH